LEYHAALAELGLAARAGLHVGPVVLRPASAADIALGAKPVEVEGLAKPLAARVMAMARGIGRGLEQEEEAVGPVDLAPVVAAKQVARPAIVLGPQGEGALVTEALRRQRAVDGVGEQQCDDLAHPFPPP